jgi:maltose O-acetyltransferase
MKTEKEKMLAGELYFAGDPQLKAERIQSRMLLKKFNETTAEENLLRKEILQELVGGYGKGMYIEPPFYCDYGSNIYVGEKVFFQF